jgi:tetratricopeptide (TPR) repeat protein
MIFAMVAAALLAQTQAPDAETRAAADALNRARVTFEYGDYPQASKLLSALLQAGRFESVQARAEAWRLLGLALFYQGRKPEAHDAFLEYLYLEPDAELDPFFVPPAAVSFFEQVKKEAEPKLGPLRAQKRAAEDVQRRAAAEEAERRRQRELEAERRRLQEISPSIERRVVEHQFWVALMPFGIGQLQNGDKQLGITLAVSQVVAGAASAGSALLIETLRNEQTGKFDNSGGGATQYQIAQRLNVVKWVGAALFYALWVGGAVHAAINYKPEEQLPDRLLPPAGQGR